jgi:hypothetical protein
MDFSLHEQRTLARIEQELSADRRLAGLVTILDSRRSKPIRRLRSLACRLRHSRDDTPAGTAHHVLDTRPLLALTVLLTVACGAVLGTALAMEIGTLVVFACVVLPLPPLMAMLVYLRIRRFNRPRR